MIAGIWLLPGRKRVVPYSIQTLKRLKPALFRQDLIALFELLQQQKIKPLIAQRFPLAPELDIVRSALNDTAPGAPPVGS
jgi:hypothetical protein